MKKSIFLTTALLSFLCYSCKKEGSDAKSKTDLLTQSLWVISNYESRVGSGAWVDYWHLEPPCEQDNKWTFKADGSLEYNEAALACSGHQPNDVLDVYRWNLLNNETKLKFDIFEFAIDKLDEDELIISTTTPTGDLRYVYKH
jgi:hypothetical protein